MNCMKCGREIGEEHVFCSICLADMEKYPVKPGTAVQIPSRKDSPTVKKPAAKRRQMPTPEERIKKLKKRIGRLTILWLITLLLLAATAYPTVKFVRDHFSLRPGQNYTTITDLSTTQP